MIDEIQVQDLALIRDATLAPSQGLTVITGETGAGKTALLSALKLLMGERASADMVRDGSDALVVSGRFFQQDTDGLDPMSFDDAGEVVAVRRVGADGRSRATVNGVMVSMRELGDAVAPSIDLCGQFEHQQLMKVASHRALLDEWTHDRIAEVLAAYREAFAHAQEAQEQLARVQQAATLSSAKLDDARFTLKRIDEVDPKPDEYEQLLHDLEIAEHAESLVVHASTVHEALSSDGGALDALNTAIASLDQMGVVDPAMEQMAASLREVGYVAEDVSASIRAYRDEIEFDPEQLVVWQERMSTLQGLMRSYGPRMEDVFARREEAADLVSLVDDSEERLKRALRDVDEAERQLAVAADELDAARAHEAPRFMIAVGEVMARLEMGAAQLACAQHRLERSQWTQDGPSSLEFLYRPGEGLQPRPFARIASGGEVSRVMLAIKVVLGEVDQVDTLVFDEVDAGVGGATAVALADVIADLARTHQVLVVTHLAQVAVRADTHYVVSRVEGQAGTETQLSLLEGEQRVAEIARMLSGDATATSLAHAREMLETAR